MTRPALALGILLFLLSPLLAEEALLPDDPSAWLGFGLAEVFAASGPPSRVAVARGPEAWQDDVIFEYGGGFSLSLFENRLWRISFGSVYRGSVFGVFIGDSEEKLLPLLGQPWLTKGERMTWRLPWKGYPVELSIEVREARVFSISVSRSDF